MTFVGSIGVVAGVLAAIMAVGCAGTAPAPTLTVDAGLDCVDDSATCRGRRQAALDALLADTSRSWVYRPPTASAYASGVRLFAFKQKKRDMNCAELGVGQREAKAARETLRAASSRLSPGQIARGAMLGEEVSTELDRERRRRMCKA